VGVPVVIGSRDAARAQAAAQRALAAVPQGSFEGLANPEAAQRSDVVVLSVPFRNQSEILQSLREVLREGQLLVDATVPLAAALSGKATRMIGVWQGSAAQQAQEMVPDGVRVVSALHTVSAATLTDLDAPLDEDVLVCGDRRADKRVVAALLGRIAGLRPVDAGRLEMARIAESLTALMISMNARYKTHAGVRITGLPGELWPAPSSS
jgi:NADPH-dependent F420 reductase